MINLKSECTRAKFIEVGCRIHKRRYHNEMIGYIILMLLSFVFLFAYIYTFNMIKGIFSILYLVGFLVLFLLGFFGLRYTYKNFSYKSRIKNYEMNFPRSLQNISFDLTIGENESTLTVIDNSGESNNKFKNDLINKIYIFDDVLGFSIFPISDVIVEIDKISKEDLEFILNKFRGKVEEYRKDYKVVPNSARQ